MHLDCVFNILGKTCCMLAEDVIGADRPFRRMVDEYTRSGPVQPDRSCLPRHAAHVRPSLLGPLLLGSSLPGS